MNKAPGISGHEYEHICAKRLKNCGFTNVTVTKGSGDQGIDITAYRNGTKYGIQCKYYAGPVGNASVQEAYAGARYYHCDFAAVLTNSTFTKAAKELAGSTNVLLWENDKLPFAEKRRSKVIKRLGIFMCVFSVLGLIAFSRMDSIKYPALQMACTIFMLLGGLFGIFEFGNWVLSLISCAFYTLSAGLDAITGILINGAFRSDVLFLLIPALVTMFRAIRLYRNRTDD